MSSSEELDRFIASTFRSVWALEVLCHLRQAPRDEIAADELISALRASEVIIARSIAELTAAGLIQIEKDGRARYAPATDELDGLAAAAQARYATAPDSVRRTIVRAANPGATAFADAFRLKGSE
jgi:hypothetical protein